MAADVEQMLREAMALGVTAWDGKPHWGDVPDEWIVDSVWDERIPQACQTCKGSGVEMSIDMHGDPDFVNCPDCPTLGTLLLWGWNAAAVAAANSVTPEQVLAVGRVMWEANGNLSRFADPEFMAPAVVEQINSMLAYILTVDPARLAALREVPT